MRPLEQRTPRHLQIGHRKQRIGLLRALRQTSVAHFDVPELTRDGLDLFNPLRQLAPEHVLLGTRLPGRLVIYRLPAEAGPFAKWQRPIVGLPRLRLSMSEPLLDGLSSRNPPAMPHLILTRLICQAIL